jgi:hypothetical protein
MLYLARVLIILLFSTVSALIMAQKLLPQVEQTLELASLGIASYPLSRDESGRYLHLKLKRFPSMQDLTTPSARRTWQENPHDGSVGLAPNSRSACRWCHGKIRKGCLRYQLFLQCHKGCKNSAYFHEDCIWHYPETVKMQSVGEFNGLDTLPEAEKENVEKSFANFVVSKDSKAEGAEVSGTMRLYEESGIESASGNASRPPKKKLKAAH